MLGKQDDAVYALHADGVLVVGVEVAENLEEVVFGNVGD